MLSIAMKGREREREGEIEQIKRAALGQTWPLRNLSGGLITMFLSHVYEIEMTKFRNDLQCKSSALAKNDDCAMRCTDFKRKKKFIYTN